MAKLKHYKSGYRRPTLAFHRAADDPFFATQHDAYLIWLCKTRRWLTVWQTCPRCNGAKTIAPPIPTRGTNAWRRWKKARLADNKPLWSTIEDHETCPTCDGVGKTKTTRHLNLAKAQEYIDEQRARFEQYAYDALEGVRERLHFIGMRPALGIQVDSLAEYDSLVAGRKCLKLELACIEIRRECMKSLSEAHFAEDWQIVNEDRSDWHYDKWARWSSAEENEINNRLRSYGIPHHSRWILPGRDGFIHVGDRAWRSHYDDGKPPKAQIVFKATAGRAPGPEELNRIVDEALQALFEDAAPKTKSSRHYDLLEEVA